MACDIFEKMLNFAQIESAVRHGYHPDSPKILESYLEISNKIADLMVLKHSKRSLHLRVANTLLDTICDTYIPKHWRSQCLDKIYQPVFAAQQLSFNECDLAELRTFNLQLNTLGKYFI